MTRSPSLPQEFPYRIARRLSVALSLIIATVLLVGGLSIFLVHRIFQNEIIVTQESTHVMALDRVHFVFDDLIFEIRQMEATGHPAQIMEVQSRQAELMLRLEDYRDLHRQKERWEWKDNEEAGFTDLVRMAEELRSVADPDPATPSRPRRLTARELDRLSFISFQVPVKIGALNDLHRARATALEQDSRRMIQGVLALYLGFTFGGGALIVMAGVVFRRRLAAPLRALAEAALGVAEGRSGQRVPVRSRDELGLVSHAFNIMDERVGTREREIMDLHLGLQARVLERTRELEETLHQLTSAQEALVRSERAALTGQIAAAVTHGIRIPLSALAINLQLLQRALDRQALSPERARPLLSTAHLEVDRINRTLEEFFRYSRLPKPRFATVDCNAVVRQVAAFLEGQAENARVDIRLNLEEDLPAIQGDADQLREALTNLSSNAIQAMPSGGHLSFETCRSGGEQAMAIMVRVRDTGVGIAAKALPHIFEPFFSTKDRGLGLGLPIALRIAEEHGGSIQCRSTQGEGTSFEVILPVTPPAHPSGPEDSQAVA